MKKVTLYFLALYFWTLGFNVMGQDSGVNQFDWMIGTWRGDMGKGTFTEVWERKNDQLLIGQGYYIAGKDTLMYEDLRIQQFGAYWAYIPMINNGAPTMFVMIESKDNSVVFENKEHDFPQRIIYTRKEGIMTGRIEGNYKGQFSKEETPMKKIR